MMLDTMGVVDDAPTRSIPGPQAVQLRDLVRSDTPEGFATFYTLASGSVLPQHGWQWVQTAYAGRTQAQDTALEAARGFRKTTIFTNFFTAYQIGLHPERSNIFIQASEDSATDNAKFVASLITTNPAFKFCFPGIVPDKDMGWGVEGYFVKREDMDYGEWRRMCTSKDPTLIGAGYKSSILIGRHPTGLLIIDDIHDHRNTRSMRELRAVLEIHSKIIRFMPVETTWTIYIFTIWVMGDVGDWAAKNPNFVHCRTPAYVEVDGKRTTTPTWPDVFPRERLLLMENEMPVSDFALMMLCDPSAAQGIHLLKEWLHYYDFREIKKTWPCYIGVDYASIASAQERKGSKRDRFALAVGRLKPEDGNLIVVDGWFGHLTQGEAEDKVAEFVNIYHPLRTGVEKLGKGEEFGYLLMKRELKTHISMQGVDNKGKGERFELQMAPVFRDASVMLSDDPDNEFLAEAQREWLNWDGTEHYYDDILDSMWHLIRVCKNRVGRRFKDEGEADLRPSRRKKPLSVTEAFGWKGRRER